MLPDTLNGKTILVTGGAGYLATSLTAQLKNTDCQLIRFDRPNAHFLQVVGKAQVNDLTGDIREVGIWDSLLKNVDVVFHFAAQTSIYQAEQQPQEDFQINVAPMLQILETCRSREWRPIILFSGTATEVGLPQYLPVDETHPDQPITIYDFHKWLSENYLRYYCRQGWVKGAILRLANIYGPGPVSSSSDRGVLNMMIRRALSGQPITIYGQGNFIRDYIYIEDVARAFINAAIKIDRVNSNYYLIGSGNGTTIADAFKLVAARVENKTGKQAMVEYVASPSSLSRIETRNFVANTRRFKEAANWEPAYSFIEGIDCTIDSYLKRDL